MNGNLTSTSQVEPQIWTTEISTKIFENSLQYCSIFNTIITVLKILNYLLFY